MSEKHNHRLEPERVRSTIETLAKRIHDRFPESGLYAVSRRLEALSAVAGTRAARLARPFWTLRIIAGLLVLGGVVAAVTGIVSLRLTQDAMTWSELIQAAEAGLGNLVYAGVAIFFLFTVGIRIRRRRTLKALHELRSAAHIIDMHQLTKDPERLKKIYVPTASSPSPSLSDAQLGRYLNYCSELFSLTGKVAAVYIEAIDDPPILAAASEIETLCTGLSRKVWQKINVLQTLRSQAPESGMIEEVN